MVAAMTRLRAGRYLLLGRLREGGTAVVWRAVDTVGRVERALKAVPLALDGGRVAELEGEVAARVTHRSIIRVFDTFEEAGHGWVVMELAAGSLADVVETHGPLPGPLARRVAIDLCEALAAAHAAGVVHRDVKPQNVLVLRDGGVRLADFGIAQVHASGRTHTRTGAMLGTIPFMAPEQRRDPRAVRPATDVYAMAVLLAWMRTGRAPGELYVAEALDTLKRDLRQAGEPDDALVGVLAEAGAYDAASRPADAGALLLRLTRLEGEVAPDTSALAGRLPPADLPPGINAHPAQPYPIDDTRGVAGPAGGPAPTFGWGRPVVVGALLGWGTLGAVLWAVRPSGGSEGMMVPGVTAEALADCPMVWRPAATARTLGPRETVGVVAEDLDGDGHVDPVFANQLDESLSIYWGDGAARLGVAETLIVGRVSGAPAVGDLDGDGRADLLVPDADRSELRVYRQEPGRRWTAGPVIMHPDLSIAGPPGLLRWDDDDVLDLLVVAEGGLKVRRGLGGGAFAAEQATLAMAARPAAVVRRPAETDAVLVGGLGDVELLEAGASGVARRVQRWASSGAPVVWNHATGPGLFLGVRGAMVELMLDGASCARGPSDTYARVGALADLDGDGTPEGLGFATCSGCTSNHLVVGGG